MGTFPTRISINLVLPGKGVRPSCDIQGRITWFGVSLLHNSILCFKVIDKGGGEDGMNWPVDFLYYRDTPYGVHMYVLRVHT